jgi:hypothetical protein
VRSRLLRRPGGLDVGFDVSRYVVALRRPAELREFGRDLGSLEITDQDAHGRLAAGQLGRDSLAVLGLEAQALGGEGADDTTRDREDERAEERAAEDHDGDSGP